MHPKLTFVQISDSHIGTHREFEMMDRRPFDCLKRVVEVVNSFSQPPDFVIHTGDLSNDRSKKSYALAAEALEHLQVPFFAVNGNHDSRAHLRERFGAPPHPSGDPAAPLHYTFDVKGERFLVVDAWSAEVRDPLGLIDETQLAAVRAEAEQDGPPLTVFLHYPLFKIGSPWLDENMPIVNGELLHAALLPARERLRGVFHGHLHRSSQIVRDGIPYFGGPSTLGQYLWQPWTQKPQIDPASPPSYQMVYYTDEQVIVQQYGFS